MLLGVLCLAGCSEEVPQNVFFDKEEATVTSFENSVNVGISADCKWNIQVTSGNPTVSVTSGEGQAFITVTVRKNKTYDGIDHTIVITSENGKSSDSFTIHQWPLLETTADSPLVSCEGGSFDVKVKSSDTFSDVETPDWITFTSSRAMKDYVYSFKAEPNKTGKMRTGSVWLKGMLIHEEIVIKQDSYAPTGVVVNGASEKTVESELNFDVELVPEYADWSKIKIETSKDMNATLSNGTLSVKLNGYGIHTLKIKKAKNDTPEIIGSEVLYSLPIERFPDRILSNTDQRILYVGEEFSLKPIYESEDYVYSISDNSIISIDENNTFTATGKGHATISVEHPKLGLKESVDIKVQDIIFTAWMDSYLNWSSSWSVNIIAVVDGTDITSYSFVSADYNRPVVLPQGKVEGKYPEGRDRVIYEWQLGVYANSLEDLRNKVKNIKVEFLGTVRGETVKASTNLLPRKPDGFH